MRFGFVARLLGRCDRRFPGSAIQILESVSRYHKLMSHLTTDKAKPDMMA